MMTIVCHVSFRPARKIGRLHEIHHDSTRESPRHTIVAEALPELVETIRGLGVDFGRTCATNIRMAPGHPEPDGFRAMLVEMSFLDCNQEG